MKYNGLLKGIEGCRFKNNKSTKMLRVYFANIETVSSANYISEAGWGFFCIPHDNMDNQDRYLYHRQFYFKY